MISETFIYEGLRRNRNTTRPSAVAIGGSGSNQEEERLRTQQRRPPAGRPLSNKMPIVRVIEVNFDVDDYLSKGTRLRDSAPVFVPTDEDWGR